MTYALAGSNSDIIMFDNEHYAILRDDLSGLSGIPAEYEISYAPGVIGAFLNSTKIIEREITLHIAVLGNGRAELEAGRQRLIDALNPLVGECRFLWHTEDGNIRYLNVRPQNNSPAFGEGTSASAKHWDCTVELVSHDPCWYSYEVKTVEFVNRGEGVSLPMTFPFTLGSSLPYTSINNAGSVSTPVVIELHGKIVAPLTITNVTTSQSITVKRSIDDNETLLIDTSPDDTFVTHISSDGTRTNAMYYCSVGSQFWQLEPGHNLIQTVFTQTYANASGTIMYNERWIGI